MMMKMVIYRYMIMRLGYGQDQTFFLRFVNKTIYNLYCLGKIIIYVIVYEYI